MNEKIEINAGCASAQPSPGGEIGGKKVIKMKKGTLINSTKEVVITRMGIDEVIK